MCVFSVLSKRRRCPQARESHLFKGTEQPVKEYDCVLIYDEEMGVSASLSLVNAPTDVADYADVHP